MTLCVCVSFCGFFRKHEAQQRVADGHKCLLCSGVYVAPRALRGEMQHMSRKTRKVELSKNKKWTVLEKIIKELDDQSTD